MITKYFPLLVKSSKTDQIQRLTTRGRIPLLNQGNLLKAHQLQPKTCVLARPKAFVHRGNLHLLFLNQIHSLTNVTQSLMTVKQQMLCKYFIPLLSVASCFFQEETRRLQRAMSWRNPTSPLLLLLFK